MIAWRPRWRTLSTANGRSCPSSVCGTVWIEAAGNAPTRNPAAKASAPFDHAVALLDGSCSEHLLRHADREPGKVVPLDADTAP